MIWVPWPKSDARGIARYVCPEVIQQLALEVNREELLRQQHGRSQLVHAIYDRLVHQGIQYAREKFAWDRHIQLIRTAHEMFVAPREGTCLDLALLFCSVCLGYELLPFLVMLDRHAFAAVSLTHGQREADARDRHRFLRCDEGLLTEAAALHQLVERGAYLAVECTGFAHGGEAADHTAERIANGGVLTFAQACTAGLTLLGGGTGHTFRFAAEIATLHQLGYQPLAQDLLDFVRYLGDTLLEEAGGAVRRRFRVVECRTAFEEALSESLAAIVARFPLTHECFATTLTRFQSFIQHEEVIAELSQLIDPRPDRAMDLHRLRTAFDATGLTAEEISSGEFGDLIRELVGTFYRVASQNNVLQGAIEINLLQQIVTRLGALEDVAHAAQRTAEATERTADHAEAIVSLISALLQGQDKRNASLAQLQQILESQPGRPYDKYQAIASGLGRFQISVIVDATGQVTANDEEATAKLSPPTLSHLHEILASLRQAILRPEAAAQADELALRRQRYLELLMSLFRDLRLEGLSTSTQPIRLPLEKVYVQLRAVAEVPEAADAFTPEERRLLRLLEEAEHGDRGNDDEIREAQLRLDAIRRERWTKDRLERFPISQALADPNQRGLVILGDPGSGKTTLLQFLALVFAQGPQQVTAHLKLSGSDADRLPIFAPLASYDDMLNETPELTIQEFLARYYDRRRASPGLGPLFDQAMEAGRALVLLDGLDEVIDEQRRQVVAEHAGAFVQAAIQRGNRVIVTSRIYGYRAAPLPGQLRHITVLDFRREEIALFARQWFRAVKAWESGQSLTAQQELAAQEEERALLADIRSNPGVERLAVNPLLLTMLVLLRRQVGRLPQWRIKLYDQYVTALVENWEETRSRGARLHPTQRVDLKEAEGVLIELALWLQQHRPSGTATRHDLLEQLTTFYLQDDYGIALGQATGKQRREAAGRAESVLHDMRQYSGLLIERGQNAFGFRHLTFQEYFAGRALARMEDKDRWQLVQPNLHSNRWHEPLLLAAARLGVSDARDWEASHLVERILNAESEFEALLHRDLLLATDCAVDDIGVTPPVLQQITAQLETVLESRVPALQNAALRRLYHMALLRAGAQARVPEAVRTLSAALPVESTLSRYGNTNDEKRELLQKLLADHLDLRPPILAKLEDQDNDVRQAAVRALSLLLEAHPDLRPPILAKLEDPAYNVRQAAVEALSPLLEAHPDLRPPILAKLDAPDNSVRWAAVAALYPLVASDDHIYHRIIFAIHNERVGVELFGLSRAREFREVRRRSLAILGNMVAIDTARRRTVIALLRVEDWQLRKTAVEILAAAGHAALREAQTELLATLDDERGFDSWPARLTAAELLLNDDRYSGLAIDTILLALEYGIEDVFPTSEAAAVRKQAALALGKLKAAYRQPRVVEKVVALLATEQNPQVLDGLYDTLTSLAATPELE
jgi:NACHT domain/HEAT repeats